MTQEEKDLLLADLCSRLPYGVKIETLDGPQIFDIRWLSINMCNIANPYLPYLFPLSSMTVEQRCKVRDLLPDKCEIVFANSEIRFYGEDYHKIKLEQFEKLFNFFNMWHLDYRGLIPMGLANDATDLNIY